MYGCIQLKRKVPSKRQAVVDDDTKLNLLLALEENPITPARQLARDRKQKLYTGNDIQIVHNHDKYFPWLERHLKTERIEEEPNEFIVSEEAEINTLACIEPFKYQVYHHLYEADHQRRLEFCNWFMVQQRPNLSRFILFTDESRFTNLGMFNKNNSRYWARENPHLFRQGAFQERFGVNVWMGLDLGSNLVYPVYGAFHAIQSQNQNE
ncbi:hypothetical protein NQ318_023020 [Aromia moschata]|uniref:Uncharacterized protein n=1 Tax=Aromia moschata TaxID=1265417 RepID=A0AAV8YCJ7_9CUCU|nr:hypothetical protein NQ318_023020 [Aromia moschata]